MRRLIAVTLTLTAFLVACEQTVEEGVTPTPPAETPMATRVAEEPSATPRVPPTPVPTPAGEGQVWRWVNVTVFIPEGSDVGVGQASVGPDLKPPNGGWALEIWRVDEEDEDVFSNVFIDADNGAILSENIRDEDRSIMEAVLKTITVAPLDRATAPWPYGGELSAGSPREQTGAFTFIRPDPATGLYVFGGIGDPGGKFVGLRNGRSVAFITLDPETKALKTDTSGVMPEDLAAFERWLGEFKPCDAVSEC
jgi:hypothetical protein